MQTQTFTPWPALNHVPSRRAETDLEALELARLEGESPACGAWEDVTELLIPRASAEVSSWENEGGATV